MTSFMFLLKLIEMLWSNDKCQKIGVGKGLGWVRIKDLLAQTIPDKIFRKKWSNTVKLDRKKFDICYRVFLTAIWKVQPFDERLGYVTPQIWYFFNVSLFPNFLRLNSFGDLCGNLYNKFARLYIKFLFTCGEWDMYKSIVKLQTILTRIAWNFTFCSLRF